MSRAAERVGRTQAALSQQVKRLEMAVQQTLMIRTGRGITLTMHGERLLLHAQKILRTHDEAIAELLGVSLSGNIRFGCPDDYARIFLPPLLQTLRPTAPAGVRRSRLCIDAAADGEAEGPHPGHRHRLAIPTARSATSSCVASRSSGSASRGATPTTAIHCNWRYPISTRWITRQRRRGWSVPGASIASLMRAAASRDSWQWSARARRSPCSRTQLCRRICRYCRHRQGCRSCRRWASASGRSRTTLRDCCAASRLTFARCCRRCSE